MIIYDGIMDQKPKNVNKFWMLYRDAVIGSWILEKRLNGMCAGCKHLRLQLNKKGNLTVKLYIFQKDTVKNSFA